MDGYRLDLTLNLLRNRCCCKIGIIQSCRKDGYSWLLKLVTLRVKGPTMFSVLKIFSTLGLGGTCR